MGTNYKKGLLLSLGSIIQTQVDLQTVIPSSKKKTGLNRVCPEHILKLSQTHHCPGNDGGEGHYVTEYVLAAPTATGYAVPDDPRPEAEAAEVLNLTPVPAKELADNIIDGDSRFYMVPSSPAMGETYQVIRNLLAKDKVALVTKGSLRQGSNEKLWRIEVFRDTLVLAEIAFPDHINEPPELPEVKVTKEMATLVGNYVEGLMSSWDEIDKTDTSHEQIEAWLAQARQVEHTEFPAESGAKQAESLMEALRKATEKK